MSPVTATTGAARRASRPEENRRLIGDDNEAPSVHGGHSETDTESDDDGGDDMLGPRSRGDAAAERILQRDRAAVLDEHDEAEGLVESALKAKPKGAVSSVAAKSGGVLSIFSRPAQTPAKPYSDASRSASSAAPADEEKRRQRRRNRKARRRAKKARLLDKAEHGEDGELMYEMEEGGFKDGSSTGDSSSCGDSVDERERMRHHAGHFNSARWRRQRCGLGPNCGFWVAMCHAAAAVFVVLGLIAWTLTTRTHRPRPYKPQALVSNGTALFAPTTLVISLDGFRADFLNRGLTPRLNAFIREGVSPPYMLPAFPSVTFPNHYTLATGLHPESHGIVGNTFWDSRLGTDFYYTDPNRSLQSKWWRGEPFWVTAEKAGVRTAIHMWPGSEADLTDFDRDDGGPALRPSFLDQYNGKEPLDNKVRRILELLDLPGLEASTEKTDNGKPLPFDGMRPQLIAAYVPNVDGDGHRYGPNSTEIRATIAAVDTLLDKVFAGLEERNLTSIVNVVVVSDHGMATTDTSRLVQLEDLVDLSKIEHVDGWPLVGLRPKKQADVINIYRQLKALKAKAENEEHNVGMESGLSAEVAHGFDVYLRDVDMPERYHFSADKERIAPLWIVPRAGWAIVTKDEFDVDMAKATGQVYHPRGLHGYDHEHPLMRAIFVARGPAFPHAGNSRLEVFREFSLPTP